MFEYGWNVSNGHDISDRPSKPICDSRIIQPFRRHCGELGENWLYSLRMGSAHVETEKMVGPLFHQTRHMVEEVRARDRVVFENYRMGYAFD